MLMGNNNNNNKQTFQNAKLTEKVAQARAVAITKYILISVKQNKSSATVWSAAVRCPDLAAQEEENSRTMKMPVAQEWQGNSRWVACDWVEP